MVSTVEAVLLVAIAGALPALALTRSPLHSISGATAAAVAISGLAGIVAVGASLSFVATWWGLVVLANGASVMALVAERRRTWHNGRRPLRLVCVSVLPTVLALLVLRPSPLAWDPRSIWWFHASWFADGTDTVRAAIADPATQFSHVDYPVGAPALTAVLWRSTNGEDLTQALASTRC